jgi:hypothetical protein
MPSFLSRYRTTTPISLVVISTTTDCSTPYFLSNLNLQSKHLHLVPTISRPHPAEFPLASLFLLEKSLLISETKALLSDVLRFLHYCRSLLLFFTPFLVNYCSKLDALNFLYFFLTVETRDTLKLESATFANVLMNCFPTFLLFTIRNWVLCFQLYSVMLERLPDAIISLYGASISIIGTKVLAFSVSYRCVDGFS